VLSDLQVVAVGSGDGSPPKTSTHHFDFLKKRFEEKKKVKKLNKLFKKSLKLYSGKGRVASTLSFSFSRVSGAARAE